MEFGFSMELTALRGGGGPRGPTLTVENGVVTASGGAPGAPRLSVNNGVITAEAA